MKETTNSPTHRVLGVLMSGGTTVVSLHKRTKANGQSLPRWGVEVLEKLVRRKLVKQDSQIVTITNSGVELFYDLERRSNIDVNKVVMPREKPLLHTAGIYDPKGNVRPMREGSQDFLKCPSRVGNKRNYRADAHD